MKTPFRKCWPAVLCAALTAAVLVVVSWLTGWPFGGSAEDAPSASRDREQSGRDEAPGKLEKQFDELQRMRDRLRALQRQAVDAQALGQRDKVEQLGADGKRLLRQINRTATALDKELAKAREARPNDPIPQWLTGELLKSIGGEPDQILPYLQKAVDAGLKRPRLFATMAQVQIQNNQFTQAYRHAARALEHDATDRYLWNAFTRAAFALQKVAEVAERIDRAFPQDPPAWAKEMRRAAEYRKGKWEAEVNLRRAERKADDLPRVHLVIQHRRFVLAEDGSQAKVEVTGKGEAVIELFEDQAPATVANFIDLVSKGFYDGTRFHQAEPATLVAGGDPNSKNADPSEDGTGGPGYVIPDEFRSKKARGHFRGSVSMVNRGPHTAGSQFFITLVPNPLMDGRFTVFGRVIQGQYVIDRISQGRTTKVPGRKTIPGDLLLRAEVIRKRAHEYQAVKEKPER
jgi:peptidyl-prolyl cis-trans isomerase B (cyclophilin B)